MLGRLAHIKATPSPRYRRLTIMAASSGKRIVLWFRNDLRIHDNPVIHEAMQRVQAGQATEVLPVYTFDPRWFQATHWNNGYPKTGPFRAQYLLESVTDLKQRLKSIGSDLLITMGAPETVLPPLAQHGGTVLAQAEVTSEETRAEAAVARALLHPNNGVATLELVWGSTLYHLDDLPFVKDRLEDMPDVFTPFRNKCEDRCGVRPALPTPTQGALPLPATVKDAEELRFCPTRVEELNEMVVGRGQPQLVTPKMDVRTAMKVQGGETVALQRLQHYLWDSDLVAQYFEIRNGMIGEDYSTKLSPALAHGCISPRQIYHEIQRYEKERTANKSTYWVVFELIWRDYFKFFALKHGDRIFHEHGISGRGNARWRVDQELLTRWKQGRTGWPLVDANMRELAATGWMSNRGRQNVASFLALDLGLDWRLGADWFESLLSDYDPCSNWGNWVAAAGLTGGRVNKFNIVKQSKDYDPQGAYIRLWCPELAKVPASRIHEPWLMSKEEQDRYDCHIGQDYPQHIPASAFARRADPGQQGGGNKSNGGVPARFGNNRNSSGRGQGRGRVRAGGGCRARSAFELYG